MAAAIVVPQSPTIVLLQMLAGAQVGQVQMPANIASASGGAVAAPANLAIAAAGANACAAQQNLGAMMPGDGAKLVAGQEEPTCDAKELRWW